MDFLWQLLDVILHLDKHLAVMIADYGTWIYIILFVIIFLETGLVVTPFLPGDSLLFAAGALAAVGRLDILPIISSLWVAAVLGDTVNYWMGNLIGERAFRIHSRFFRKEYLNRTREFYRTHGGKTIFLARFIPIIRTFAPFVAGIGTMRYGRFLAFNLIGGGVWIITFSLLGFYMGKLPLCGTISGWLSG